ncbi:MAG: hypothetical protein HY815_30595 [Candidatus Riflebacteria bacterium]|nr:hypothetical protein [Candidatus Riflebacteria bacterium]
MNAYTTFVFEPLDWPAMEDAAGRLIGTRNFVSFCTRPIDQPRLIRTIDRLTITPCDRFRFIDFFARSFVRGMVRNIVGWLLSVGRGIHPPAVIDQLLAKTRKDQSVRPAPPQGLYLVKIWYDGDPMPGWFAPLPARADPADDEEIDE